MLLPGCRCCVSCGECESHTYSVGGLPLGTCRNQLLQTKTITIPEKFFLPCRVALAGSVDDDLEVNGQRVRYQLSEFSTTCAVKYDHIQSVTNFGASQCPGAHYVYHCFLSYERTFTIALFDNFGDSSGYDLQVCFGGGCVEPPPFGACCEYPCDGCTIQARPQLTAIDTNCLQLGYGSEEFPPIEYSRTAIFSSMTDNLPIQWAAGYPAALTAQGITKYWIVLDSSENPWCTMCGGELYTDLAVKYRWRLLYVDCVNEYPPKLKDFSGGIESDPCGVSVQPFVGKTQWDGSAYPVCSDGTWQDTEGKEISGCRPDATSIEFLPFRGNPYMTCVPICSQTLLDECVEAGSINPSWFGNSPCEVSCVTRTDNPLP